MLRRLLLITTLLAGCHGSGPEAKLDGEREIAPASRNVLLIVLDTVRDDRIGVRGLTPHIDALAARSLVFENACSNAGWTLPAHASLFTGLYPVRHRATQETLAFGIDLPTLAEEFDRAGWATFAASANGVVSEANGLARGFDRFEETFRRDVAARFGRTVHPNEGALVDFLDSSAGKPWFAFLNFIEAHLPYRPPAEYLDRFVDTRRFTPEQIARGQRLRMRDHYLREGGLPPQTLELLGQLYDAEIAGLDASIGHLLDTLEARGDLRNTVVVITSDHGENLGEHGHLAHVFDLHNTLLEVPLMISVPGVDAGTRDDPVQLLDLFPTLLALNGIDFAHPVHGRDLFAPGARGRHPVLFAESYYPRQVLSVFEPEELEAHAQRFAPFLLRQRVAQTPDRKWWWRSNGHGSAYDLAQDRFENVDRADQGRPPRAWSDLADSLDTFVDTYEGPDPLLETPPPGWMMPGFEATIDDPELLERLRSLGYVH